VPDRERSKWQHLAESKAERHLRKQIQRNRQPSRPRRRDWPDEEWDGAEPADLPERERIMPRGERERRRMGVDAVQQPWAVEQASTLPVDRATSFASSGVVVTVSTGGCHVHAGGRELACSLRGSLGAAETMYTNIVAVGDRVLLAENGAGAAVVDQVLPRHSVLARPDVFYPHRLQVVVANADQLLIVASWRDPVIWLELIDRLLITARLHNLYPVVCVNKVDLAVEPDAPWEAVQIYRELGHRVLLTSAATGQGVDRLRRVLRRRTTAVAGVSGVGKSSLLNAVEPGLGLRVAAVSQGSGEGRHTTSQVQLAALAGGGYVVDTPGIREFGLSGLLRSELIAHYPDLAVLAGRCRFRDCSHLRDPGCAVRAAAQAGRVSPQRYHSYGKIYQDLPS
jgi:ribosome biogenesis GTPase